MTDLAHRAELAIAEHLVERVRIRLADRAGGRHAPPWDPKTAVRIGVLRPQIIYPPPVDEADDGVSAADVELEEEGSADEESLEPPSNVPVIGLDFTVDPEGLEEIVLRVDVEFSLYHPAIPTRLETIDRFRQLVSDEAEIALVEEELAGDPPEEGTGQQPSVGSQGPATSRTPRSADLPLQSAWIRSDIVIGPLQVSVRCDGDHNVVADELARQVREDVRRHFDSAAAARPFRDRVPRTIPPASLETDDQYEAAIASRVDGDWVPSVPVPDVTAFAEPLSGGEWLVSVSLTNSSILRERPFQDLSMYDCQLRVKVVSPARLTPQRFQLAPDDYRFWPLGEIVGHGRACVAEPDGEQGVRSQTLPSYAQMRVVPRTDHVPAPVWRQLAVEPQPILSETGDAMRRYREEWELWIAQQPDHSIHRAARADLEQFGLEYERFNLGRRVLEEDAELLQSFKLANRAFDVANARKPFDSWRLFQLIYIVSNLPALAARRHRSDPTIVKDLDFADVLWFPTGGGKTEAYLGLILTAIFYDRLRGKDRGASAWLKFPLRMLSVQQLGRVLRVLCEAEKLRVSELGCAGAPFELGYLVGGGNTPNRLHWPDRWWPGFDNAVRQLRETPGGLDTHRLVAQCPLCDAKKSVSIVVDEAEYRVLHKCLTCGQVLPLHITDEEIYRYQPTVIVSTVDKITGYSYFGDFTSFSRGPRLRCPDHGYLAFGKCTAASSHCARRPREYLQVGTWTDPVPALIVQDEMHLIREELGAFESHYEGLIAELQRGGPSVLPSKILAATATIEKYENQLSQVYGRIPRSFPSQGWERHRSFYTFETDEVQRIFLGVSPAGGGIAKVYVSGEIQVEFLLGVQELQDDVGFTQQLLRDRAGVDLDGAELERLLFDYETSLAYVNSKSHGAMISESIGASNLVMNQVGGDQAKFRVMTGDVPLPELADVIDQVEDATVNIPRSDRLRALIGTSVVSHGVDLERLNCMVMVGLPSTTADYIQATSRSGRTHVGVVATVFDNFGRRESSTFTNFVSMHRFLDRLVEPVPVNKYAENAVLRTLPGIVVALLWDLARQSEFDGPEVGIRETRELRRWWNAAAGAGLADRLLARIQSAYRAQVSSCVPNSMEERLVHAATQRWTYVERTQMEAWLADKTTDLFREPVMSSLRDIDVTVRFGGLPDALRIYEGLFGYQID